MKQEVLSLIVLCREKQESFLGCESQLCRRIERLVKSCSCQTSRHSSAPEPADTITFHHHHPHHHHVSHLYQFHNHQQKSFITNIIFINTLFSSSSSLGRSSGAVGSAVASQ